MPELIMSRQSYERRDRGFPPERLVNMFVEGREGARPALLACSMAAPFSVLSASAGAVRGVFQMDGVLGGDVIAVTDSQALRVTKAGAATVIGTLPAPDRARIATSLTETIVVAGNNAYQVLSGGVSELLDPDLGDVVDVGYIAGRFVYVEKDSDRIKWSDVLSAGVVGSASFATAEGKPDRLRGLAIVGEDLVLLGYETVEIWGVTGDATLPFQPRSGARAGVGCASRDSIVVSGDSAVGNRVSWLGDDRTIRMSTGGGAEVISTPAIHERLAKLSDDELAQVNSFAWTEEGRWFVAVQTGVETMVYDLSTGLWHQRESLAGVWSVGCACQAWGQCVVGRDDARVLGLLSVTERFDFGERVQRGWTAVLPLDFDAYPVEVLAVRIARGDDPDVATEREIWMRYSDDRGNTWSSWMAASLGSQGAYQSSVTWGPLGCADAPGRVFEFEVRDPFRPTVTAAFVNEVKA
jgi:hypothetical protein